MAAAKPDRRARNPKPLRPPGEPRTWEELSCCGALDGSLVPRSRPAMAFAVSSASRQGNASLSAWTLVGFRLWATPVRAEVRALRMPDMMTLNRSCAPKLIMQMLVEVWPLCAAAQRFIRATLAKCPGSRGAVPMWAPARVLVGARRRPDGQVAFSAPQGFGTWRRPGCVIACIILQDRFSQVKNEFGHVTGGAAPPNPRRRRAGSGVWCVKEGLRAVRRWSASLAVPVTVRCPPIP